MAKLFWSCCGFTCLVGLMVILRFAVVDRSSHGPKLWGESLSRSDHVDYYYNNGTQEVPRPEQIIHGREYDDDPRCMSRTQQLELRQVPTKFFPKLPSELQQVWARYGDLHRKCTEGKDLKRFFHKSRQKKQQHRQEYGCKYLLYLDGVEGLGNRFLSLASAWAYAMLTDRVLLIDTRRRIHKLLCEPFPHSSWLLPHDFPYHSLGPSLGSRGTFKAKKNMHYKNGLMLYLRHDQKPGDSQLFCENIQLFCENIQQSLNEVTWISWVSNLYQLPNLFLVPSFWQKLRPIFPSPDHSFALISRLLLNPSNEIWSLVLQQYKDHLSSSTSKVGVQVRLLKYGRDPAGFSEKASDMIIECLMNNSFLPRSANAVMNESARRSRSANILNGKKKLESTSEMHSVVDVGVQVASLQGQYYERIKDLYSQHHGTVDGRVVSVHTMCSLRRQDQSFRQSQLAYVEMLLLSFCDKLATSASSTFGYMAQSWGSVLPLILDFGELGKNSPGGSICARVGHSLDPCAHAPRVPQCLAEEDRMEILSADHKRWLDAHLHHCQDRPSAWQLVGGHNPCPHPVFFGLTPKARS